ncbi:sensor histidine kinase, partial [Escherichia coli]|nr:sensor histidine kinase [Escherichia coli]
RVLANLIQNAVDHGGRNVTLRIEGASIEVEDDGPGIPEADRARIFEPFFTSRRSAGGTGLGLPIARSLLASHGGTIALAAAERGTCFEIRVPAA